MAQSVSDEQMLDAALEAFAARGFNGTSVREVARSLGVSHNLIPQRFGSKERLWFAAVDHGFGRLAIDLVAATEALDGDEVTDIDRLRAMVVRFVEANAERPSLLRIINQEATTPGPRLDHLYDSYIDPVREFGARVLAELRSRGEVRSDSVMLLYFLMVHGAGGAWTLPALAARFGEPVEVLDDEARHRRALEAVDVIFDGLAAT